MLSQAQRCGNCCITVSRQVQLYFFQSMRRNIQSPGPRRTRQNRSAVTFTLRDRAGLPLSAESYACANYLESLEIVCHLWKLNLSENSYLTGNTRQAVANWYENQRSCSFCILCCSIQLSFVGLCIAALRLLQAIRRYVRNAVYIAASKSAPPGS